ncbi:hypothetical protein ABT269_40060 [Streptomyces viridosporus]|uniref:hypothetical protein n=1 Tax=Streptomyces TaxID=1883 RepID=UPI00037E9474|nr:hypothetical protein [Streptomyces sp. NWU49]
MHHRGRPQIPLPGLPWAANSSNRIAPYFAIRPAFACPRGAAFCASLETSRISVRVHQGIG